MSTSLGQNHGAASKLEAALVYARFGFKIFPLFEVDERGRCTCGDLRCDKSKGKHPRVKDWQGLATIDEAQIRAWWAHWPNANIGVLTGAGSNLTVLDVDGAEGAATLKNFEINTVGCSELPPTPCVKTGGKGGLQYYFQHVPGLRNRVKFAPGLDVRNDGGYVVGAGSVINSPYAFESGCSLGETALALMPRWLIERIRAASTFKPTHSNSASSNGTDCRKRPWSDPSAAEVESALASIDADDYGTWLAVGMALHREFAGSDEGFQMWSAWSAISPKYDPSDQSKRWTSFSVAGNGGQPVTIKSLFRLARDAGWQGYRPYRPRFSQNGTSKNGRQEASSEDAENVENEAAAEAPSDTNGEAVSEEPELPAPYSEIALSNHLIKLHGQDMRFVNGEWVIYSDKENRWMRDDTLKVYTLARRLCTDAAWEAYNEMIQAGGDEAQAKAKSAAARIASAKTVAAVVALTRGGADIAATADIFDQDPWLLNTPSGAVNLKDGSIRKARREDYFTKRTPNAPEPIPTPIFDQFLLDIMGGRISPNECKCNACATSLRKSPEERQAQHQTEVEELCRYLLRFYGYCLSGDTRTHVLMLQIGDGGNGKGVLNDLMSKYILGVTPVGYATDIPVEALLVSRNDRHPTELMDLFHARLALAREAGEDVRLNEGLVKRLTGGDRIKARRMRQDFVEFDPSHKVVFFANATPKLRGSDQAAWKRRLHLVLFQQKFGDEADEQKNVRVADKDLGDKLRQEAPGILYKLIEGCLDYQKLKLKPPATVRRASEAYLLQQNAIARFVQEKCIRTPLAAEIKTKAKDLWAECAKWAEENKEFIGNRNNFNERLEKLGIEISRSGKSRGLCHHIRLRTSGDEAEAAAEEEMEEKD